MQRREFIKSCASIALASSTTASPLCASAGSLTTTKATEWKFDAKTGKHYFNPDFAIKHSVCLQCHGECGIRAIVKRSSGDLVRLIGNPWHPNTKVDYLDMGTALSDTATRPGTLCARGISGIQVLYDPHRITVPLKRNGPRGSNQWVPISWEQLIHDVVEGGKLYAGINDPLGKDVEVKGFRWLYERRKQLIDEKNPDYGHISNQLVIQGGRIVKSRKDFQSRFAKSFGTVNNFEHTNICEQSHHIATGYVYAGKHNLHADLCNSEFVMYWGTAPGEANFPMQTLGKYSAIAREKGCKIVVIDPVLPVTVTSNPNMQWVAIKPGTDGALAMAMVRHIIEQKRFNEKFLTAPSDEAAKAIGELNSCDATWLVITQEGHPNQWRYLQPKDIGLDGEGAIVVDAETQKPTSFKQSRKAELFYVGKFNNIEVKSVFSLLYESSKAHSLEEYAAICGVPTKTITSLADELMSHGRKAVVEFYRGIAQHTNAFYTGLAIYMLNMMIGNLNWKGGASTGGGAYDYAKGRYDLTAIPELDNAAVGLPITREKAHYQNSSEFKRKIEQNENPYPPKRPWFPYSKDIFSEIIPSALEGYPYRAEILIWQMATPLYSAPGQANQALIEALKDPHHIPLIISSDIVIGDSTLYADYIVPDITYLERYVHVGVPDTVLVKGIGVRSPVVEPLTQKKKDGSPYCYETFLIDVAKALGMKGFGENAIVDNNKQLWPLNRMEDWYLKATANVAFNGEPCPDATQEDIAAAGLTPYYERFKACLRTDEWAKTLFVMSHGGRFEPVANKYKGEQLARQNNKTLHLYAEKVAMGKDSMTGARYSGMAHWQEPMTILGKKLASLGEDANKSFIIVTQKSPLQSHSRLPSCTTIREIRASNAIEMNAGDAKKLGIRNGDRIRVETTTGTQDGTALLREGVAPGVLSFIVGFGHKGYGAANGRIGNKVIKGDAERARGVNLNPIMKNDPDVAMMALMDPVGGSASFYDTRAKVIKL